MIAIEDVTMYAMNTQLKSAIPPNCATTLGMAVETIVWSNEESSIASSTDIKSCALSLSSPKNHPFFALFMALTVEFIVSIRVATFKNGWLRLFVLEKAKIRYCFPYTKLICTYIENISTYSKGDLMENITTVAVRKSTLSRLKGFREYGRESYDETINKLMSVVSMAKSDTEGELNKATVKEIAQGRREIKQGKGMNTKELMKKLGIE